MTQTNGRRLRIAFMIIDYVPHQVSSIRAFIEKHNAEVLAFHVGRFEKSIPVLPRFTTHAEGKFSEQQICEALQAFAPDVVVVAGWMIKKYVNVATKIRKSFGVPVVALSDTQWNGTTRQKINAAISPFYVKKAFSHLWVAGLYQYEYARRLGFEKKQIILNSLSAEVDFFSKVDLSAKVAKYPKRLLYIGRFAPEKGLDNLLNAWSEISDKNGWILTLVGKGDFAHVAKNDLTVERFDYMDAFGLRDMMQNSGAFVLPSKYEPWALVIHEAAAAGLPIIATEVCGAVPHFVISHYNGIVCIADSQSIKKSIERLIHLPETDLLKMSRNSRDLAQSITIEKHTASLMQVL